MAHQVSRKDIVLHNRPFKVSSILCIYFINWIDCLQHHHHVKVIHNSHWSWAIFRRYDYMFLKRLQEVREDKRMRGEHLHIPSHSIDNYFLIQQLQYCIGGLVVFKDKEEAIYNLSAIQRIFGRQVSNLI